MEENLDAKSILQQMLTEIDTEEHVKDWAQLNHVMPEGAYASCYRQGFVDCFRYLEKKIK